MSKNNEVDAETRFWVAALDCKLKYGDAPAGVDYRDLLRRYIQHVLWEEGSHFIYDHIRPDAVFSDDEWQELKDLGGEETE